jgi:2'-5' RNA ligase
MSVSRSVGVDGTATIGVSISIPSPFRAVLDRVRAGSGDPLAPFVPAHVTLLGPADVGNGEIDEVQAHLSGVAARHRPYRIHLRGTGTFRPVTEVVFVVVAGGGGECASLASDVRDGPLARDLSFPYHPHVTIAHDVPTEALDRVSAELAGFEARFTVDHFTLYVHDTDGRWRPLRDFALAGGPRRAAGAP